jgi:hypothetical protein
MNPQPLNALAIDESATTQYPLLKLSFSPVPTPHPPTGRETVYLYNEE